MCPAGGFGDRDELPGGCVEFVELGIGVSLQDAGIASQVSLRVFAGAVSGTVEHRRLWFRPGEGPVVAKIGPDPVSMTLPPPRTGTVCCRHAGALRKAHRYRSSRSAAVQVPTQSASVERLSSTLGGLLRHQTPALCASSHCHSRPRARSPPDLLMMSIAPTASVLNSASKNARKITRQVQPNRGRRLSPDGCIAPL